MLTEVLQIPRIQSDTMSHQFKCAVEPLPNTNTYIFLWAFHYTSLPFVSVPVLSLEPSSVSRTAVISRITLGFSLQSFHPFVNTPTAGIKRENVVIPAEREETVSKEPSYIGGGLVT